MKPSDSKQKPGIFATLRNRRGFSLIEIAIVLVIIGIIIGAIIKGQDLILNSRAKQVTSAVSTWRNHAMAFMDRNGRFPGDELKDGIIGNAVGEQLAAQNANAEITASMTNVPTNPIVIGATSFWVYFGHVTGVGSERNVIAICKTAACSAGSFFTAEELEIIKAIDTALDGSADAGVGQLRAATALTLTTSVVRAATLTDNSAVGTPTVWNTTDQIAAVWAFDRPY